MENIPPSGQRLSDPETWVDQHGDYLFRNALLRVRDRELAEELVQETLLAALEGRDRFGGQATERTWMMGILRHKTADYFRRASREESREEVERLPYEEEGLFEAEGEWRGHWRVDGGKGPLDWGATPAAILERKEFWEILHGCLAQLPVRLARAFGLREIDGLEGPEVCKILGITATNLGVMLYRCRMQLRRCIERRGFAEEP